MPQFTKILKIDITCSDTLYNTGIKISVKKQCKNDRPNKTLEHFSELLKSDEIKCLVSLAPFSLLIHTT